jgi:hypothetical protein
MKAVLRAFILSVICSGTLTAPAAAASATNPSTTPEGKEASNLQHGSVVANGVRLHYVVAGSGKPVILLNGWPESWYTWRHLIPALARADRRVYALEPRGFGDSEKPLGGYDPVTPPTICIRSSSPSVSPLAPASTSLATTSGHGLLTRMLRPFRRTFAAWC